MRSLWYVSKYMTLPGDRVGERSMLLLRELHRVGWKVTAFASDSNHLVAGPEFSGDHHVRTVDGVDVCWVRTRKYRGAKSLGRILSWLDFEYRLIRLPKARFGRPEAVIVSSLSILSIFSGLAIRRKYGCKLILEVRDIWPLTIVEEGGFGARNPFVLLLGWIERLAYRKSDAIVGTMPNLAEHVREVAGVTGPVFCVPMGIDEQRICKGEPLPQGYAEQHIPQGKFIVCHAGTIGITNALDTLLECARAIKDRSDIHFLVVGEGDLKEQYRTKCVDLPNVSFPPSVTKAQVQSLLGQVDLLYFSVHPSKVWRFGQSLNKVIDYMLSGKPVVASYTGYPSMVNEAGSGVYVPAGDVAALKAEIERYVAMPEAERAGLGEGGRRWLLDNRTYPKLARDYAALIEATLGR